MPLGAGDEFVEVGDDADCGSPGREIEVVFPAELPGVFRVGSVVGSIVSEETNHDIPFSFTWSPGKGEEEELVHPLVVGIETGVGLDPAGDPPLNPQMLDKKQHPPSPGQLVSWWAGWLVGCRAAGLVGCWAG